LNAEIFPNFELSRKIGIHGFFTNKIAIFVLYDKPQIAQPNDLQNPIL